MQRSRYELLLGEAGATAREVNLREAWAVVHDNGLLQLAGRDDWPRSVTPPEVRATLSGLEPEGRP